MINKVVAVIIMVFFSNQFAQADECIDPRIDFNRDLSVKLFGFDKDKKIENTKNHRMRIPIKISEGEDTQPYVGINIDSIRSLSVILDRRKGLEQKSGEKTNVINITERAARIKQGSKSSVRVSIETFLISTDNRTFRLDCPMGEKKGNHYSSNCSIAATLESYGDFLEIENLCDPEEPMEYLPVDYMHSPSLSTDQPVGV